MVIRLRNLAPLPHVFDSVIYLDRMRSCTGPRVVRFEVWQTMTRAWTLKIP